MNIKLEGNKMKNLILLSLLFVMFMGVVYGAFVATGTTHPDMTGTILGVNAADQNSSEPNSILVQGVLSSSNQMYNVSITVSNDTQIFMANSNGLSSASFSNLKPGDNVNITFMGPIIQSYPPQVTGKEVDITS